MKYAVYADAPIDVPAHVRRYLRRKARAAQKPGTPEHKAKQARMRRLRRINK